MKSLLGILALLLTVSANAATDIEDFETDFWGNKVLRCSPATVATLAQQEDGNNRLNVTKTSYFRCGSSKYAMEVSELVLGLKINGPEATGEVTLSCRPNSENFTFEGSYNYFGIGAGLGYAGFIGQAAKLGEPDQRDCVLTINGYEILEVGARVGRINIIPMSRL